MTSPNHELQKILLSAFDTSAEHPNKHIRDLTAALADLSTTPHSDSALCQVAKHVIDLSISTPIKIDTYLRTLKHLLSSINHYRPHDSLPQDHSWLENIYKQQDQNSEQPSSHMKLVYRGYEGPDALRKAFGDELFRASRAPRDVLDPFVPCTDTQCAGLSFQSLRNGGKGLSGAAASKSTTKEGGSAGRHTHPGIVDVGGEKVKVLDARTVAMGVLGMVESRKGFLTIWALMGRSKAHGTHIEHRERAGDLRGDENDMRPEDQRLGGSFVEEELFDALLDKTRWVMGLVDTNGKRIRRHHRNEIPGVDELVTICVLVELLATGSALARYLEPHVRLDALRELEVATADRMRREKDMRLKAFLAHAYTSLISGEPGWSSARLFGDELWIF